MRFDTVGGIPFVAMQRYAAISKREIRAISSTSPSHSETKKKRNLLQFSRRKRIESYDTNHLYPC